MTKQKLGQNFLHDKKVALKIVESIKPHNNLIVEIGPGKGIMTHLISEYYDNVKIIAIEKDIELFNKISRYKFRGVEILHMDILKANLSDITENSVITILGNIPYYISKDIIDWIIKNYPLIKKGILMVQKEFFSKISSSSGSKLYNPQSVIFSHIFDITKLFKVKPGSFSPPPKITSIVFTFEKKESGTNEIQTIKFYKLLKTAFRHRRKTLFNNLKEEYDRGLILSFLKRKELQHEIRSEDITKNDLFELFLSLQKK